MLDALKGADPREAKAFVKDMLSLAGISAVGGRSAEDIASRFLDRAREDAQALGGEQAAIIRRFLAISGEPDQVSRELRNLADEGGLDLSAALDRFDLRTGFLEARGFAPGQLEAAAGFARNLDYYSGFVFEINAMPPVVPWPQAGVMIACSNASGMMFRRSVPRSGSSVWERQHE